MSQPIYTVTQINRYIKGLMDDDPHLQSVLIRGEISNYKMYPSGHHYFSLKDSEGALSCVMFRRSASRLRFRPENGMKVVALGSISAYPRDGKYQLYCEQLSPDGVGDLHVAFEQLKEKLFQEGLFSPEHKKPIPAYPRRIALITSPVGAAVRDMLRILKARWPMAQVIVMPVRVQGAEAAPELTGAVNYAGRWQVADLIIIGRGGGSMEDLWCFNDEGLARAIYDCPIPVISAVGHEPDVTICDYVADLRAATPSNGAELAVADWLEVRAGLAGLQTRLGQAMLRQIQFNRQRLERSAHSRQLTNPECYVQDRQLQLDHLQKELTSAWNIYLSRSREQFARLAAGLDALSPLKVLSRGYSMATDKDGHVISTVEQAEPGDAITLQLSDGRLGCTVNRKEP